VAQNAPEHIPALASSLTQELVEQARGGDAAGAVKRFRALGEETRKTLFPESPAAPSKAAAIGSYLERAAELGNVKGSLPKPDALVSSRH
jgi:hypothetical protein